jgi:hypothetical protein
MVSRVFGGISDRPPGSQVVEAFKRGADNIIRCCSIEGMTVEEEVS